MYQLTFLFLGVVAFLSSAATMQRGLDSLTRVTTGTFAMIAWAYWSISAFSVEVATLGGRVSQSYPGLAAIGLSAAAIMLVSVLRLGVGSMNATRQEAPMRR